MYVIKFPQETMSFSSDEDSTRSAATTAESSDDQVKEPPKKKPQKEKRRGSRITVKARMAQFPGVFMQQGSEMWCIVCQCTVNHKESTFAKKHLKSERHLKNNKLHSEVVTTPGPSAVVENEPIQEPATSSQPSSQGIPTFRVN